MECLLQWDELSLPNHNAVTRRRIGENLKADIFIARDSENYYSVLVQHQQDLRHLFNKYYVEVGAVSLDYRKLSSGYALQFKLQDEHLIEYFDQFIQFVLKDLQDKDEEKQIIESFLKKLKNWKKFISSTKYGKLSAEQIRGLIAELSFLDGLLEEYPDYAEQILNAWYGPERLQHDFIFKDMAVEVKSVGSIDKRSIKISSVHQLECNLSELYLHVVGVLEAPEHAADKRNLNQLVADIKSRIESFKDAELIDIFEYKLLESHYVADRFYESPHYIIRHLNDYLVESDFPRIHSGMIPNGVVNVGYELDLSAIENYKTHQLIHKIKGAL